jgi:hypothetical protein
MRPLPGGWGELSHFAITLDRTQQTGEIDQIYELKDIIACLTAQKFNVAHLFNI